MIRKGCGGEGKAEIVDAAAPGDIEAFVMGFYFKLFGEAGGGRVLRVNAGV